MKDMKSFYRILAAFLLLPASLAHAASPVVMEFFTTRSCHFSNDAERVFKEISEQQPNVITISCHVGTDTLTRSGCKERHAGYFDGLNLNSIYTPLVVFNGKFDTSGKPKITRSGLKMTIATQELQTIDLQHLGDVVVFEVDGRDFLPEGEASSAMEVWMFAYDHETQVIGDSRIFTNVVKETEMLARWEGAPQSFSIPAAKIEAESYAVLVQKARGGEILAAGKIEF